MDIYGLRNKNRILTQNKFGYNKTCCRDLYDYQEMIRLKYPDEWERKFKNKWPIRIIYYYKNKNAFYEFYVDRNSNMRKIMTMFKNYLDSQIMAIINCFGHDIGENIISYMPDILDNSMVENNYLYVHVRSYERIKSARELTGIEHLMHITERVKVPDSMTVNRVHGQIALVGLQHDSRYTILRLKDKPCPITKSF
tara:strand:- start:302 stop:889 length:588 start_codon:yes stop_codon:yes gene_type:complete